MKLLAIRRDAIFSPNSIEKDRIILQQVMDGLGTSVRMIDETRFSAAEDADVYVSMARHKRTLELLKAKEDNGALVINSAYGVERCERSLLDVALREQGIPVPNSEGSDGYWLKRGDMSAQNKGDVVYCKDRAELAEQQASFVLRGITNWVVQAHVPGDLVKFYAVQGGFFRYFYPNDDGISKFGDEEMNGKAQHYGFDVAGLQATAEAIAMLTGVEVYGGDAIITASGAFYIIDFNDWPSFSRCRDEASEAIVKRIKNKINKHL